MRELWVAVLVVALVAGSGYAAGLDEVVAPGTVPEKLADGFKFTEGATVNKAGEFYFVDQPNNKILRWTRKEGVTTFMEPAGRANGMCFAPDGNLLVCADEKTELWSVTPDKKVTVLTKSYEEKPFNGPNDVWAMPQGGGCYFTDPFYKRSWWDYSEPPQPTRQVYWLAAGGKPERVTDDLTQPNGLVGTPDGKVLYVSDIDARQTWAYDIQADGKLANKRLFCEFGSDGMTIDADGRLYLTGREGVYVYSAQGESLGIIKIPEAWTANLCIGGPKRDTLFITALKSIYAVQLKVKGTGQGK